MTADGRILSDSGKFVSKFLDSLPSNPLVGTATWNAQLPSENEAIVIPTQVIFFPCLLLLVFPFSFLYNMLLFTFCRLIMLEKQLTFMKLVINLMGVHM